MRFGEAVIALENGFKVARDVWKDSRSWLELQRPDALSRMTKPYIFITHPAVQPHAPNSRVPWMCAYDDIFANDWRCI